MSRGYGYDMSDVPNLVARMNDTLERIAEVLEPPEPEGAGEPAARLHVEFEALRKRAASAEQTVAELVSRRDALLLELDTLRANYRNLHGRAQAIEGQLAGFKDNCSRMTQFLLDRVVRPQSTSPELRLEAKELLERVLGVKA